MRAGGPLLDHRLWGVQAQGEGAGEGVPLVVWRSLSKCQRRYEEESPFSGASERADEEGEREEREDEQEREWKAERGERDRRGLSGETDGE